MPLKCKALKQVDDISQAHWQQLSVENTENQTPFLSYAFLKALEATNCVGPESGWHTHHLALYEKDTLVAFLPCYLKTHSYGEYVFDHAWANAYQHHQIPYYPKLVCCIPFTPVTGSRVLINKSSGVKEADVNEWLKTNYHQITKDAAASSLHLLFVPEAQSDELSDDNLLRRLSVQFIWQNENYQNFDSFLTEMTSRKRRSIRKERASIYRNRDALVIKQFTGNEITPDIIHNFYLCYQQTYLKRSGHSGYLNLAFFQHLLMSMQDSMLIVMAFEHERCIASSLFFYNEHLLAGRYWGALEEVSGLHFECCYYQGIEFCIAQNITNFNPGTQGEHKILRGFRPQYCFSQHHLLHSDFHKAVADFLSKEAIGIRDYKRQAESVLPFKQDSVGEAI